MNELIPGIEVVARGLRWELVDAQPIGDQTRYRLRGLEGAVKGIEMDILSPLEEISALATEINSEKAAPLKNWLIYHQSFLLEQMLGSQAILSIQPGRLTMEPYQIVPLMRALKMSRPRLLLCDDVGLGKTIQAALIVTELMARRLAHRVLVISPAGPLLRQWQEELLERFGLRVEVIDRAKIEDIRRKSELGANPFDQIPLGLVSIDFLKQERILEQIERTTYDIIIIDEAHHCADLGAIQDYDDSLRRNLAQVLANRCDVLLLLTATPHNGNDRSFASLLELLDMSLVDGRGVIRGEKYKQYAIRRLKKHIKDPITGEPKFKERQVIPVPINAVKERHQMFIDFQKGLLEMIAPELKSAFKSRRYSDVLAFIALLKRSVSTVYSCLETLKVIRDRFDNFISETSENQERRKERIRTIHEYAKRLERFGTISFEEEQDHQNLIAEDIADQLAEEEREVRKGLRKLKKTNTIKESISNLIILAEKALECDPKIEMVAEEVINIRKKEPKTNILIYTEYTDTQIKIIEQLNKIKIGKVLALSGGSSEEDKMKITEQFRIQDNIILVSTDAAAEGLNLQQRCHNLIHFELPFNPNRLEQRNGRIDRYGQEKNPIVRYLFLKNTFEDRILLRLIAKYERQRSMLSFVPNTLGIMCSTDASCARLLKGFMDEEEKLFKDPEVKFDFCNPDEDSSSDPAVKELLEEIDKSFKGFRDLARNNIWLGEAGVNTEQDLFSEAIQAQEEGKRLSGVELLSFVCDAIKFDGGTVKEKERFMEIHLPPLWCYGLGELPGYDAENKVIRLTSDLNLTEDEDGNKVAFLGRSHPLVKMALDRVRNVTFGNTASQDIRASAVTSDDSEPALLLSCLCSINTKKHKLFEKVIGIKIDKSGVTKKYLSPEEWIKFANPNKAIRTTEIWNKHFKPWGDKAKEKAQSVAKESFNPMAKRYIAEKKEEFEDDKARVNEWFEMRVKDITGIIGESIQYELFEPQDKQVIPSWAKIKNPIERISAFATDKKNLRSKCSEAETLLRLYKKRIEEIDNLSSIENISVRPLGLLMLVPKEDRRGT